jgi:hypothetical protein
LGPIPGRPKKNRRTFIELFEEYMPGPPPHTDSLTEGCWDWVLSPQSTGYGRFTYVDPDTGKKRHMLAHRASYQIHVGPIPTGLFILHSCDRPICCQPFHLRPGTNSDNIKDAYERGRMWGQFGRK